MIARHSQEGRTVMSDYEKAVIDELAKALQVVALLSTQLRKSLGAAVPDAERIEEAAGRAVRAMKRLQPPRTRR